MGKINSLFRLSQIICESFRAPAADPVAKKFDTEQSSPVVGIIETETEQNGAEDDGEVFYIFYENENLNQVNYEILKKSF